MANVIQILETVLQFIGINLKGFVVTNVNFKINWAEKSAVINVTFEDLTQLESGLITELTKWLEKYEHFVSLTVSGNMITILIQF